MKVRMNRIVSLALIISMLGMMIFSDVVIVGNINPAYAEEISTSELTESLDSLPGVDPGKITNTTNQLIVVLDKMVKDDTAINTIKGVLTRATQIGSLTSGCVAVLQMCGILKDPTKESLQQILTILNDQNVALRNMQKQLDDISTQLIEMKADAQLTKRATEARDYASNFLQYQTDYLEAMQTYMDQYKTWTLVETKTWAYMDAHKDLYAYYNSTTLDGGKLQQTYSKRTNKDLSKSDNGEDIVKENTVGLPSSYVDAALADYNEPNLSWDVNTYREDIVALLVPQIDQAIKDDKLVCSDSFKQEWQESFSADDKKNVAHDLLNSAIYIASLKGVNSHADQVSEMISKMNATWSKTKAQYTGLSSLIVPIQDTYCFEGEARDKLNQAIDVLNAQTSMFGIFTMALASQSDYIDANQTEKIVNDWIDGGEYFDKVRKTVITGHDNYCYLNGCLVSYKEVDFTATSSITCMEKRRAVVRNLLRIDGHDAQAWKAVDASGSTVNNFSIVDSSSAVVIYSTYLANNNAKSAKDRVSFSQYLANNNTGVSKNFTGSFMTHYGGVEEYQLANSIKMKAYAVYTDDTQPKKFNDKSIVDVMRDNEAKKYVVLHERLTGDLFSTTGQLSANQTLTARAQYCESHGHWYVDEPWYFAYASSDTKREKLGIYGDKKQIQTTYTTTQKEYILECKEYVRPDVEFDDDEFDQSSTYDGAFNEVVDTSLDVNEDAEILSLNSWKKLGISFVSSATSDIELKKHYKEYIDDYIKSLKQQGISVKLSKADKAKLKDTMTSLVRGAEEELSSNMNMADSYWDPFGLYGNDAAMEKLAKKVLPATEITSDGQTVEPVKNMITAAFYEPYVYLSVEKSGDTYSIKPMLGYIVKPSLLVWKDGSKSYSKYDISDSVMEELGLTMRVRMSAAFAGSNNALSLAHFDNIDDMNKLETLTGRIQGYGANRYADVTVTRCSLFVPSYYVAPNTSDSNDVLSYVGFIVFAILGLAGCYAVRYKRTIK